MKKFILATTLILSLTLPVLCFAGYLFEQEIDMGGKQKMKMVYSVQGDSKRIDTYQGTQLITSQILSPKFKEPVILVHNSKNFMTQKPISAEEAQAQADRAMQDTIKQMESSGMDKGQIEQMKKMMSDKKQNLKDAKQAQASILASDFTFKPTGQTKSVGKYKAENVQVFYKGNLFQDNWVTKEIPKDAIDALNSFATDKRLNPDKDSAAQTSKSIKAKLDGFGYPVLVISKYSEKNRSLLGMKQAPSQGGFPEEVTIEMKNIEKRDIPATDFSVPKDYTELKMPGLK
jgi:hypothetical protein